VSERRFAAARLDEIEAIPVTEMTLRWLPIRRHFGIRAFGVNAYVAKEAGDDVVEEHTERTNGHQELYTVLKGHARFTVAGEEIDAPSGTLIFIRDPGVQRAAKALEPGTTVLALGAKPAEAYEPSAWEDWFLAYAYADAGERERRAHELQEVPAPFRIVPFGGLLRKLPVKVLAEVGGIGQFAETAPIEAALGAGQTGSNGGKVHNQLTVSSLQLTATDGTSSNSLAG